MKLVIIFVFGVYICFGQVFAEQAKNELPKLGWANISIISSNKKLLTMEEMYKLANGEILKKNTAFRPETYSVNFYIDPASAKRFVTIDFFQGIGKDYWRVYFSKEGKINGSESGTAKG